MSGKNQATVHIQFGDDGNPEIKASGSATEQAALCVALMAGLTMMYGTDNLADYLTSLVTNAVDLVEHMTVDKAELMEAHGGR